MKRIKYIFCLALLSGSLLAQIPAAFSFQGLAMDDSGHAIINQGVRVQVAILIGDIAGAVVYDEAHFSMTSQRGLFNIEIGRGVPTSGSFELLDWETASHFAQISVKIEGSGNQNMVATFQLLSVPYALVAQIAGSGRGPQGPQGIQGPEGPKGFNGYAGPQGENGQYVGPGTFTGRRGDDGKDGPVGPVGPQGESGLDIGEKGPDGEKGDLGPDYDGPNPIRGEQGPAGPQGEVGPIGEQGPQGEQGDIGPQGLKGRKGPGGGIQGDPGPQGPVGPNPEIPGPSGSQGISCYDSNRNGVGDRKEDINGDGVFNALDCLGVDGPQGLQGPTGPTGYTGANGIYRMEMRSVPPTVKGRGLYLDDGTNRVSGLPGFRFWDESIGGWVN